MYWSQEDCIKNRRNAGLIATEWIRCEDCEAECDLGIAIYSKRPSNKINEMR